MKVKIKHFFTIALLFALGSGLLAQSNSQYSVRFVYQGRSCQDSVIYVDIEVKARTGQPTYFIAEQNYRFSFEDQILANPRIVEELEISGVLVNIPEYQAFFSPHNLNGSLDTIVSYNVEMGGGTGYPITDKTWVPVGRLAFDLLVSGACYNLFWHTQAPEDFPPTSVVEKWGGAAGDLFVVQEGTYDDLHVCEPSCFIAPVELSFFEASSQGCATELKWATETETSNDFFSVERSIDGRQWTPIAKIPGAGTTVEPQYYSFIDEKIGSLITYYRIKQVDFDHEYSFSDQISVRSTCFNEALAVGITQVFPNPITNNERVNVEFYTDQASEASTLFVTDELGREVKTVTQAMAVGKNVLSFKTEDLAAGIYFLQLKGENWYSRVQKLVKVD